MQLSKIPHVPDRISFRLPAQNNLNHPLSPNSSGQPSSNSASLSSFSFPRPRLSPTSRFSLPALAWSHSGQCPAPTLESKRVVCGNTPWHCRLACASRQLGLSGRRFWARGIGMLGEGRVRSEEGAGGGWRSGGGGWLWRRLWVGELVWGCGEMVLVGVPALTCSHSGRRALRTARKLFHIGCVGWCLGLGWPAIYAPLRGPLLCSLRGRVWWHMFEGIVERYMR